MLKKLWGGLAGLAFIGAAPELLILSAAGAAVNAIADASKNKGKEEGYTNGYNDASKEYEAKLKTQVETFKTQKENLLAQARTSIAERDKLINECLERIKELEEENGILKNMPYSEKQEYLEFYRSFERDLETIQLESHVEENSYVEEDSPMESLNNIRDISSETLQSILLGR